MGKVGGCASAQLEAIARLTSLCLRSNVKVSSIINQLQGIRCPSPMWSKGEMVTSCADGVAKALKTYLDLETDLPVVEPAASAKTAAPASASRGMSATCPDCGSAIEHVEGCLKCPSCGWSKC
jgi:ribonucleoside-diphosphate reductase alpha chain